MRLLKQKALPLLLSLCVGALLLGVTMPAWAQVGVNTGTIIGTVTDPSGAVIPGANVTITDASTGLTRTTATNDQGRYVISTVNPGTYTIAVTKQGFASTKVANQVVSVGQQLTANVQMQVGQATQEVVVEGTSTANLQTLNATVGNTVVGNQLESLPALGRDVSTFVTLQPGVSPDGNVAGTVVDQASFSLDGGQNTSDMDGSMTVYTGGFGGDPTGLSGGGARAGAFNTPSGVVPTPADSVEEFKVNTANQTADFNSSSGAETKVVTKRGTNTWHGTAYEYYMDNNFNANSWDNNLTGTPIPSYHYSRFGGSGGGPLINKNVLGGKTYFFANYEGFRWPNSSTFERAIPTANMRAGILTDPKTGATYDLKTLDPRGIGISPVVQQMWNKYEPSPTGANIDAGCGSIKGVRCDGVNEVGYKANIALPTQSNFGVARLDHDFGSKWHFMSSYRYYHLKQAVTNQVDIGGFFSGDTLGVPASTANRPSVPWFLTTGLTTNITANTTNDFHFSATRNFWQWGTLDAPPQISGLGGAIEPFGESGGISTVLAPFNVNTQSIRTRFWNGHDYFFRDDLTMLKGNHLIVLGGAYQRNTEWHQRSDNGGGINYTTTYQLGDSAGPGRIDMSTMPAQGSFSSATWGRDVSAVLGMVTDAQTVYVRTGADLHLLPAHTHAEQKSHIPFYNLYLSDTWHMKPTFTLTYGLGWALEMPPIDVQGRQVELVDSAGQQLDAVTYINQRRNAALAGQVFNPYVGFALLANTQGREGGGYGPLKYPYKPFFSNFSPRIAAAWNPHFDSGIAQRLFGKDSTVFRAGYGRIYGRINGVDQVLLPLLSPGLMVAVQCRNVLASGICDAGTAVNPSNVFRVGVDGLTAPVGSVTPTLPQPLYPGVNNPGVATGDALDPNFRPNDVDSFDVTMQRQIGTRTTMEIGYIGRLIHHEYYGINLNAVPYMMTMGGQQFQSAYANIEKQMNCLTYATCGADKAGTLAWAAANPQPFFESAVNPAYCAGFTNCTQAVVSKQFGNFSDQRVWDLWSNLDNGHFNFPRSMMNTPIAGSPYGAGGQLSSGAADNLSIGYGTYHGGFVSVRLADWRGLSAQTNLTYSKALGTDGVVQASSEITPNDPFNLSSMYGLQPWDRKLIYNAYVVYAPPFYKSQQGVIGRLLGGWNFAPIFTAGSGTPLYCNTVTDAQDLGAGDGANFFGNEQCVSNSGHIPSTGVHLGVAGSNGVGINTADSTISHAQINMFADPAAVYANFRNPILGVDMARNTYNGMRGLGYWNMDLSVRKNIRVAERFSVEGQMLFQNVLNHNVFANGFFETDDPGDWGVISSQQNGSRTMEFGIRVSF